MQRSFAVTEVVVVPAPVVTGVNPTSGPVIGGTSVTVTGTDLAAATAVSFGSTPAASFTVDNTNSITAIAPAHAVGTVDITVTTTGGTSTASVAHQYTFVKVGQTITFGALATKTLAQSPL